MKFLKRKTQLLAAFMTLAVVFTYQNCSDVILQRGSSVLGSSIPDATLCTRPADLYTNQLKVLFVVDMSLSNIGSFSGPGGSFDSSTATDPNGVRFQKMIDFINGCGSININNRFSILAFSGASLKSSLYGSSGCSANYLDKVGAVSAAQNLAKIQTQDKAKALILDPSISMQNTTYLDGLNCAQTAVVNDITANPSQALNTTYLVFFLTDGKPSDNCDISKTGALDSQGYCKAGAPVATTGSPYVFNGNYEPAIINMMLKGKAKASDIRFQPIYYGPASEEPVAKGILDYFSQLGDSLGTIEIASAGSVDFCQVANAPVRTLYHMSEFNAVNLTAVMRDGILQPDSDIDGVIDNDDDDPTNARSNPAGLLDGICEINGGAGNCIRPIGCNLNKITSMHLSECDLFSSSLSDGVDEDSDRVPDYIEIVRSTDPILKDTFNNLDNDSLNNLAELHVGRQVDSPDDSVSSNSLMQWTKQIMPPTAECPSNQENWKFSLKHIPLISTKSYLDPMDALFPGSKFNLSHDANENVIFIYYFVEPTNVPVSTVPPELWGTVVKIQKGASNPQINLKSSDFQKLGLSNGKVPW